MSFSVASRSSVETAEQIKLFFVWELIFQLSYAVF